MPEAVSFWAKAKAEARITNAEKIRVFAKRRSFCVSMSDEGMIVYGRMVGKK
jgi:hypothetical protein